jgi:hypothetical protein
MRSVPVLIACFLSGLAVAHPPSVPRTFGVYCWEKTVITNGINTTNPAWQTLKTCVNDPAMRLGGWLIMDFGGLLCSDWPTCATTGTSNNQNITDLILALDGAGPQATSRKMPVAFMYGWTPSSGGGTLSELYIAAPNFIDRVTDYLGSPEGQALTTGSTPLSYHRMMIQIDLEPTDCFCSSADFLTMLQSMRTKVDAWNNTTPAIALDLNIYVNNVASLVPATPPANCNSTDCVYVSGSEPTMVSAIMAIADSITFAAGRNVACMQENGAYLDPSTCAICKTTALPGAIDGIAPWIQHFTAIAAAVNAETQRDVRVSFHVSTRARTAEGYCSKVTFGNCAQATAALSDPISLPSQLDSSLDALEAWGFTNSLLADTSGTVPGFDGGFIHDLGGWYTLYMYATTGTFQTAPGWLLVPLDPCTAIAECNNMPCSAYPPGTLGTHIVCPTATACPPTSSECQGDFNADAVVDGADIGTMLAHWGTDEGTVDLDSSGNVDGADLGLLIANHGPCK